MGHDSDAKPKVAIFNGCLNTTGTPGVETTSIGESVPADGPHAQGTIELDLRPRPHGRQSVVSRSQRVDQCTDLLGRSLNLRSC